MDYRKIIDRLTLATEPIRAMKEAPPPRLLKERVLRLAFRPGQKVRDKVTGQEVEVIDGTREIVEI